MLLEIRRGQAKRRTRSITVPMFLVGTETSCDMVLGDSQFSPVHFYLLTREGHTTLRCLSDTPDVTINGTAKFSSPIFAGDRIRTGPFEFVVKAA